MMQFQYSMLTKKKSLKYVLTLVMLITLLSKNRTLTK